MRKSSHKVGRSTQNSGKRGCVCVWEVAVVRFAYVRFESAMQNPTGRGQESGVCELAYRQKAPKRHTKRWVGRCGSFSTHENYRFLTKDRKNTHAKPTYAGDFLTENLQNPRTRPKDDVYGGVVTKRNQNAQPAAKRAQNARRNEGSREAVRSA